MKILELSGEIGWEIWAGKVRELLKGANGDDVTLRFSSIGGSIFEGADIYNLFADYKRDNPSATMNLEIKSVAASMGSLIASAPFWSDIAIEPTTMTMIHNPWNVAVGDYRDMESSAKFLKSSRDLQLFIYADRSGKTEDEIAQIMDDETWFMGQEIIDNGFADRMLEIADSGEPKEKTGMIASMKANFKSMEKNQKQMAEKSGFDAQRAAACLKSFPETKEPTPSAEPKSKVDEIVNTPVQTGNQSTEVPEVETKAELMKELPEVYTEAKSDGVSAERERVSSLMTMKSSEDYKDIPEVVAVIETSITEGRSIEETQTAMNAAMVKIMKDPARVDEIDSPGAIQGGDPKPEAPAMKQTHVEV